MADVEANPSDDCDDELKQAMLAAFGDDAMELLDAETFDEFPEDTSENKVEANPSDDCDDELKQAMLAAFGDDAMELLDAETCDEFPEVTPENEVEENDLDVQNFDFLSRLNCSDNDSSRDRWVKDLYRSIYAPHAPGTPGRNQSHSCDGAGRPDPHRCVLFTIGEQQFAIPMGNVLEIVRDSIITELPGTDCWLRGVTNLRGQILSVTDLRNLLHIDNDRPNVGQKIIVVHDQKSAIQTGLIVDRVMGIRSVKSSREGLTDAGQRIAEIAAGSVIVDDATVIVIACDKLFGCRELMSYV